MLPPGNRHDRTTRPRLLVVDDDAGTRSGIRDYFVPRGFEVEEATTCTSALQQLRATARLRAAVIDYQLPDGTASDILRTRTDDVPVIVLTGKGSIELAVQTMKDGATHFATKPIEPDALYGIVEHMALTPDDRLLTRQRRARSFARVTDPFVGASASIRALADEARRIARTEVPVLIQGETGSGKGVLARWLHDQSPRAKEPYVDLNCASLGRDLLESELFGHEKGAFTGAAAAKLGLLEAAQRGTIFLDEIGDMDLAVQPKVLKVLDDRRFRRLGETGQRHADVRFIAASHHDLSKAITTGRFREDLFYRINTVVVTMPPLRARREDLPALADRCLEQIANGARRLAPDALSLLCEYQWPGNIRELHNVLERAAILASGTEIGAQDLRLQTVRAIDGRSGVEREVGTSFDLDDTLSLEEVQIRHIRHVLGRERGRVDRAALRLGIPRSTLYERMKRYGLRTA